MLQEIAETIEGEAKQPAVNARRVVKPRRAVRRKGIDARHDAAERLLGALGLALYQEHLAAQELVASRRLLRWRRGHQRALRRRDVATKQRFGCLPERTLGGGALDGRGAEGRLGLRQEVATIARAGDALGAGLVAELEAKR
jgi:hypothetical protein